MKLTKEQQHERDLEYIKNFRLLDDDFAKKVFDDVECVQEILRIILDKPDLAVETVKSEYEIHNLWGRSVRFDIFAKDATGKPYDIEIQRADRGAGEKRARYNSSLIDAETLKRGTDPEDLPESYVIFITENDVLGDDLPIYHIERTVVETQKRFNDEAHIIYVNGATDDDGAIGRLMCDFRCTSADDIRNNVLAHKVRELKDTEKGVSNMCKAMEEMRAEAAAAAAAEAAAAATVAERVENIKNLMANLKWDFKQAAAALGIPQSEQERYAELIK